MERYEVNGEAGGDLEGEGVKSAVAVSREVEVNYERGGREARVMEYYCVLFYHIKHSMT